MRHHPPSAFLAAVCLLAGLAGCDGPRETEPGLGPLVASEPIICEGHTKEVFSVVVSPDGRLVASGSNDQTLRFWNARTGKLIRTIELPAVEGESKSVKALAFSPDGKTLLASRSGRALLFFDAATGKPAPERCPVREGGYSAAFSPDGKALAVAAGYGGVQVWGVAKGDRLFDFPVVRPKGNPGSGAWRVAFSPDGRHLAAALSGTSPRPTEEPVVRVWELTTDKEVFSANAINSAKAVAFAPGGRLLATGGGKGRVDVFDWARRKRVASFEVDSRVFFCLAFSSDGRAIFTGGNDPEVKRWEAATGKPAGDLKGLTGQVHGIALSKDGKVLAAVGNDKRVLIWHLSAK